MGHVYQFSHQAQGTSKEEKREDCKSSSSPVIWMPYSWKYSCCLPTQDQIVPHSPWRGETQPLTGEIWTIDSCWRREVFFFPLRYVWLLVEYPLHGLNDKCSQQAQIAEYLITWWCYLWRLWDFGEKWPCRREYSLECWHWEFIALSSFLPLFLLPICGWRCNVSAAFSSCLLPDLPNNYSLFYCNNKSK